MNVSRFGLTELDELPEDLQERIGVIAETSRTSSGRSATGPPSSGRSSTSTTR